MIMDMKKQKLYIKNENGRYEEYKPELKVNDEELYFRKRNGKYIPCGRYEGHDMIGEGVWVVISNISSASSQCVNGDYLKKLFPIQKVSRIEEVTIAQLGGLEKYYDYIYKEWSEYYRNYMLGHEWSPSNEDVIHFIIAKVFEYSLKQEQERKKNNKENKE